MDFFQHVVAIVTLVGIFITHLDASDITPHDVIVLVPDINGVGSNLHNIAFFQKNKPIRHRTQRKHIRRQEVLTNTFTHNQRAAFARSNNAIGLLLGHYTDRIGAVEPLDCGLHGRKQSQTFLQFRVHQMHNHF